MNIRRILTVLSIASILMSCAFAEGDGIKNYDSYMKKLVKLSDQNPSYPFAAMIVENKTGKILCTGVFQPKVKIIDHGEMVAINNCLTKYPHHNWADTTLLTTAEPCAMCAGAIAWTGIGTVVYGSSVPYLISRGWNQMGVRTAYVMKHTPFYKGKLVEGVLHQETDKLFAKPPAA